MFRIFCFLLMLLMLGCGDEGVILDTPSTDYGAPSAPSIREAIPLSAITDIVGEQEGNILTLTIHATHNGMNSISTLMRWVGYSGDYTQLEGEPDSLPTTPNSFSIQWEQGSDSIIVKHYGATGFWTGSTIEIIINPSNFSIVGPSENPVDPPDVPVNPVDPVIPANPVDPPVEPPPPVDPPPPPRGGYVVWLEEVNGHCQSGVIHSDYVFIDYENKTITFTGQDGEVDPGDTVREYIKVETGLTYAAASARAPEILAECR